MGYYLKGKDEIDIYIEDLNDKCENVIVFLHGWPGDHNLFEYQFDYLSKKGFRCIGIDQRGFGNSDKPISGYDYDTLSDDVFCIVKQLD